MAAIEDSAGVSIEVPIFAEKESVDNSTLQCIFLSWQISECKNFSSYCQVFLAEFTYNSSPLKLQRTFC
jgi:hypothetical protein